MEICTQNFYRKALENDPPQGSKGTRLGRERSWDAKQLWERAQLILPEFLKLSWFSRGYPVSGPGGESLLPFINQSLDAGSSWRGSTNFQEGVLSCPAPCSERDSAVNHLQLSEVEGVNLGSERKQDGALIIQQSPTVWFLGPISWKIIFPRTRVREDGFSTIQAHWVSRALYF